MLEFFFCNFVRCENLQKLLKKTKQITVNFKFEKFLKKLQMVD